MGIRDMLLLEPRQSLAVLLGALDRVGIVPNQAEIGDGPDQGRALPLDGEGGYTVYGKLVPAARSLACASNRRR